jgi:hypothetical protein
MLEDHVNGKTTGSFVLSSCGIDKIAWFVKMDQEV